MSLRQFDPSTDSLALREQAQAQDPPAAPAPEPEPSGAPADAPAEPPAQEPATDAPAPEGGN